MQTNLYEYSDPIDYLAEAFKDLKKTNKRLSLRKLSSSFGFSPNLLSMILTRKRSLGLDLADQITEYLNLSKDEREFFRLLVCKYRSKSAKQSKYYESLIEEGAFEGKVSQIDLDQFKVIADWYHGVIYEMISLDYFKGKDLDLDGLFLRLSGEVPRDEIERALFRLEAIGIIKKEGESFLTCEDQMVSTPDDIASVAIKEYHKQMIGKSISALDEQRIERRFFSGMSLGLSHEGVEKVKKEIRNFEKRVQKIAEEESDKQTVYQLNTQFFELIRGS